MAYMKMRQRSGMSLASIGEKVKTGAEIAGALKSIYDVGSTIYRGIQAAAPVAAIAAGAVL
jgi:hypothetical protein